MESLWIIRNTDKFYQDIQPDGTGGQVWQLL